MKQISFTVDQELWDMIVAIKAKKKFANTSQIIREGIYNLYFFLLKNIDISISNNKNDDNDKAKEAK